MQVLINIDESVYKRIRRDNYDGKPKQAEDDLTDLLIALDFGKPLPKGHGRLFDERDIVNGNYEVIGNRIYELEPIIEADKESE